VNFYRSCYNSELTSSCSQQTLKKCIDRSGFILETKVSTHAMAKNPTRLNALFCNKHGHIRDCMLTLLGNKMLTTFNTGESATRRIHHLTKFVCRRLFIRSRHTGGGDKATISYLRNPRVSKTEAEKVLLKPPRQRATRSWILISACSRMQR